MALLRTDVRLPADVRRALAMVSRNLDLEVRLIADLLDVSRVVSGKLHFEKRPVDLATTIREAAAIVDAELEDKEQTLAIETPGAPHFTVGDAARLQQVFWNLLRNAIKFSPERGHITIRARVSPVERCLLDPEGCSVETGACPLPAPGDGRASQGGNLVVEVIDEGSGIDPRTMPRLFNAFEQDEKARGSGGLGLGLSICRAIVELHGGSISAHSQGRGHGATFRVRLPLAQCALAATRETTPAPDTGIQDAPAAPAASRPLRVLLVEDHADTAEMMTLLIGSMGHRVVTAGTVAEALAAVDRERPDLLVSDLGLPDGSGLDLVRELVARGDAIPAIALSGYGSPTDIRNSRAAGFAAHLVKPLDGAGPLSAAIARLGLGPE
jgi:two-component system CheB/CheR fusion protein